MNINRESGVDYSKLVDARVRIRGNLGVILDASRTQLLTVFIQSPGMAAVTVLQPQGATPFHAAVTPIREILRWEQAALLNHRVHVQGRVTLFWPGETVCVRDSDRDICANTAVKTALAEGELADVVGFAKAKGTVPVLSEADFKSAGSAVRTPVAALPTTAEKILQGGYESKLIQVEGVLISSDTTGGMTSLQISSGTDVFKAMLPLGLGVLRPEMLRPGSTLRVTGICSGQLDAKSGFAIVTATPRSFRVLLRSPADVHLLAQPSWWTPLHAVAVLTLALTATMLVLVWVVILRRRVERQAVLLRESEQRFRHLALHDALTELATRVLLQDRLTLAVESAKRHLSGLGALMLDLDRFKEINDTYGHRGGDEVLRVIARRIQGVVRMSDTVARLGGDEFFVLLPDLHDAQFVENIAKKIVETLGKPVSYEGAEIEVSVSVGVFAASLYELDAETILKNADAALYRAKRVGRNCYEIYSPELDNPANGRGIDSMDSEKEENLRS